MPSNTPTIPEIEIAILRFLANATGRKTKEEIAAGIGVSDIAAVVRAVQNLRTQRKIRTFNRGGWSSFCAEHDLADNLHIDVNPSPPPSPTAVVPEPPVKPTEEQPPSRPSENDISEITGQSPTKDGANRLFVGLEPTAPDSIDTAFIQLKNRLQGLPAPRSLCELMIAHEEYQWLSTWASNISAGTLAEYLVREPWRRSANLEGFSKREAIGMLLLLLVAETARRESKEGSVWPTFIGKFGDTARSAISFLDGVNSAVRHAIEAAAQSLRLRNVFGRTGVQYYYVSIFLQFGITRRGLRQLPYWLTGRPVTETIRYLLEGSSSTYSSSFAKFWSQLVDFRNRRISEDQFRRYLRSAPWILPEWADETCRLAKAQPGDEEGEWEDDYADQLLSEPSLVWNWPDESYFQFELGNTKALGLNEPEYTLRIDGWKDIRLRHSSDRLRAAEPIRIPLSIPQPTIYLLDSNTTEKHRIELELWDPSEEIAIFDIANGKRIDPFEQFIRVNRSYAIITSDDLVPNRSIDHWVRLQKFDKICWYLPEGWSSDFSFNWPDGEPCWQPNLLASDESGIPFAVKQIRVQCDRKRIQLGESLHISLTVPAPARLKSLRIGGLRHEIPTENGRIDLEPLTVTPKIAASGFKLAMVVEYENKKYRLIREAPVVASGGVRWNGFSWEPVSNDKALEADDALSFTYKLFLPGRVKENLADYGIFEGDSFCGRLKRRRHPLGLLSGYGAPLVVRKIFNAMPDDDCIEICKAVTNAGVLKSVAYVDHVTIQIELKHPLELAEKHGIVIWPENSEPIILSSEELIQTGETTWQAICPNVGDFVALAVSYDGVRIGAQWPESIESFLPVASGKIWPGKIAAYLRWMGFPILASKNLDVVREFAYTYPDEVLAAWLSDFALHESLTYHNNWSEWLSAVRKLFRNWHPSSPTIAAQIIEKLKGLEDEADKLPSAALKLLACDPCLMYSVIREWYRESKDARAVHGCINAVLHLTEAARSNDQLYWQKDCLETAAKTLRVDARFLENACNTVLKELDITGNLAENTLANIDSLISSSAFRDFLASYLLLSLSKSSSSARKNTQEFLLQQLEADLAHKFVFKESSGKLIVCYVGDKYGAPGKILRREFWQLADAISFIRKLGLDVREPSIRTRSSTTNKPRAFRRNPNQDK